MQTTPYKRYLLAVLALILAFNYVDRLALGLLLQDVKVDLKLSDTELGFLSGLAFAIFYSVMGIPIARWADRGNRVTIIALTTGLWSAAVALCGAAGSFAQLLLVRIGVAVGEAGCIPPAHSLIADSFSRHERPRAVARYMLGGPLSFVIGYFLAGWLNQLYGWRMTFVLLGAPGLVLACVAWLTLREPRIATREGPVPVDLAHPGIGDVCATLWRNLTFRHLLICFSVTSFFAVGLLQWQPAFFIRSHGMQTGELGTWLAAATGIGGILGTYVGGELATRYAAGNERLQLIGLGILCCMLALLKASIFLSTHKYLALTLLGFAAFANALMAGPLFGTLQTLVSSRMRAMSMALIYFFSNLIGLGLGPLAAGALSDVFRSWAGEESLRYALLTLSCGYLWASWHFWRASTTVARDLDRVQAEEAAKS